MSVGKLLFLWNEFWFAEQSPLPVAWFRILFGFTVLQFAVLIAPELLHWFGSHAVVSQETMYAYNPAACLDVFQLFASDKVVTAVYLILCLAAFMMTIGLFTRTATIVVYVCLNSLILNGGDVLMELVAFYLIFTPAGDALSVDRLLRLWRGDNPELGPPRNSWPWAHRLLQLQIVVIYFQAFWSKFGGAAWIDGTALYWILNEREFLRFPVPFVSDHLFLSRFLTWSTLAIEFAMWCLVWITEFRYPVLLLAVLLHLGIDYAMNLPMFETLMIFSFVLFIDADDITIATNEIKSWLSALLANHRITMIYDKSVASTEKVVETIRRLDVCSFIDFKEYGEQREMPEIVKLPGVRGVFLRRAFPTR